MYHVYMADGILCKAPENGQYISDFYTFTGCSVWAVPIDRNKAMYKLHLVWDTPEQYITIRDMHRYTTAQRSIFDAYIAAMNYSGDIYDQTRCDLADGSFVYESCTYTVRGLYIYHHNDIADLHYNAARRLCSRSGDLASMNTELMRIDKDRVHSTGDMLYIFSYFWLLTHINEQFSIYRVSWKNYDYVVYMSPGRRNAKYFSSTGFAYIDAIVQTANIQSETPMLEDTRHTHITALHSEHKQGIAPYAYSRGLPNEIGTCSMLACMQMLYHMPDILTECESLQSSIQNAAKKESRDITYLIASMSSHSYHTRVELPEHVKTLFANFYKTIETIVDKTKTLQKNIEAKHKAKHDSVLGFMQCMWLYILTRIAHQLPISQLYFGPYGRENDLIDYPFLPKACHSVYADTNCLHDITNILRQADTNMPYIIIFVTDRNSPTYPHSDNPLETIPIRVTNANIDADYMLCGVLISRVNPEQTQGHIYYLDIPSRTSYDNQFVDHTPLAMYTNSETVSNHIQTSSTATYMFALHSAQTLLYIRDHVSV